VQCGEGGALVINDMSLHARAEIIRDKGTNRGDFLRGVVGRYRWMDIGSSYLPSEILAAFLTAQLESFEEIQHRRGRAWQAYHSGLADWALRSGVAQPTVPADCTHPAHLYYLLMPDPANRKGLLAHLAARGIGGAAPAPRMIIVLCGASGKFGSKQSGAIEVARRCLHRSVLVDRIALRAHHVASNPSSPKMFRRSSANLGSPRCRG